MTWEEIISKDAFILAIYQEASAYHVVNIKTGQPCRTFSAERAADKSLYRPDPNFCKIQHWRAQPGSRGGMGLHAQMSQRVGWGRPEEAGFPELATAEAYDICYWKIFGAIQPCQHEIEKLGEGYACKLDYPAPDIQPCAECGSCTMGADVKESQEMTAWTCQCGARRESLKRKQRVGFGSIQELVREKVEAES